MVMLKGLFMARVDAFLERTGVAPATLGRQAVGDPNLIRQLRHGRSPTLATADQLLAFMEGFDEAGVGPVSSRSDRLRDSSRLAEGSFPRPVQLGARAVGWIEEEVDEWIRKQIALSRGEAE